MQIGRIVLPLMLLVLTGCPTPAPNSAGGGRANSASGVNPEACGKLDTNDIGRKVHAFLTASAELDRGSIELEDSVRSACAKMATELEIATDGDTATLCDRVAKEIEDSLEVSVSQENRLVTKTEPAVCTTELDFAASVAAECEASVSADVDIHCDGYCGATCNGQCDGICSATATDGSCAGTCEGTCQGSCSGSCQGNAEVNASAECKASAEIRADLRTTCTEPKVVVVRENVTVVDASRLDRAIRAIEVGMPALLQAAAKAKVVLKAFGHWSKTAVNLAKSSGKLFSDLGARGVCVGVQLAAAVASSAQISARIDVSIRVSANVSASAGAE